MTHVTIRPRRDTAANWTSYNPVLAEREIGIEIGASGQYDKFKIGDGATHWKDLSYALDLATANSTIDAKVTSSSINAANAAKSEATAKEYADSVAYDIDGGTAATETYLILDGGGASA